MASKRTSYRRPPATATNEESGLSGISDSMTRTSLLCAVAQDTHVTVSDGTVFQGTFSGTESTAGEVSIVLRYAKVVSGDKSKINIATERRGNTAARLSIPVRTLVRMDAAPLTSHVRAGPNSSAPNRASGHRGTRAEARAFATDAQISARVPGQPRALQPFEDFTQIDAKGNADAEAFGDLALAPRTEKWDQFQANESKFGVQATFNEDEYTTKIDRSSSDFPHRQREAARLAAEIENKSTTNVHQQEERNQKLTGNLDEEDRYSGVLRSGPSQHMVSKTIAPQTKHPASQAKISPPTGKPSIPAKPAPPKAPSNKHGAVPAKHGPSSGKPGSALGKPLAAKPGPSQPKSASAKSGLPSGKNNAGQMDQNPPLPKQKSTPNGVPPRLKIQPQHKMSYAAAAGAKPAEQPPASISAAPALSSDAASSAGARPLRSAISPSNPTASTKSPPTLGRIPPRTRESVQNARASNGGPTPPNHGRSSPSQGRNSPLSPSDHETSAVDALSLEDTTPEIAKSFEHFKAQKKRKSLADRLSLTNDLKKFSSDHDVRRGVPRRSPGSNSGAPTAAKNDTRQSHGQKEGAKQHNKLSQQAPVVSGVAGGGVQPPVASATVLGTDNVESQTTRKSVTSSSNAKGNQRVNTPKTEGAPLAENKAKDDSNASAPVDSPAEKPFSTTSESSPATVEASQQRSSSAKPRKPKMKLNPNATVWQPPSGPTPAVSAASPAPPAPHLGQPPVAMDAYFQPMGNYAPVSAPIPEQHQAPGMPYPMAPAPMPHPHSMPGYAQQQSYPVMMPGGMPQMGQAPGYAYMPRGTFMVPGGGNRFPPAAPPTGMSFGIPVGMIPPQGNQRNPGYQFFNGQGYLPVQPPMHQPGMPPPYVSHPGHAIPAGAVAMPQQRNSMGSGRRGSTKARGRQHHGHNHGHNQGHGYSSGYSGNESHQQHGQQNYQGPHSNQYGGGAQWVPVNQGDTDKGDGDSAAGAGQSTKVDTGQGVVRTPPNAPQQ